MFYPVVNFARETNLHRSFSTSFARHLTRIDSPSGTSDQIVDNKRPTSEQTPLDDEQEGEYKNPEPPISTSAKMEMWRERLDAELEVTVMEVPPSEENKNETSAINKIMDTVYDTYAYRWLLATIRQRTLMSNLDSPIVQNIRESIIRALDKPHRISRHVSVPNQVVSFTVKWPVRSLLNSQWPGWENGRIDDIVTLTGDSTDAQAAACDTYLKQVWPLTGKHLLTVLNKVLRDRSTVRVTLPGKALLSGQENGEWFQVLVQGSQGIVVEVAEQLCWLASALNFVPNQHGLWYATPSIIVANINTEHTTSTSSKSGRAQVAIGSIKTLNPTTIKNFQLSIRHTQILSDGIKQGHCWHQLFGHAVVAHGFPILKRPQPGLGLETPLDVAAGLLGTKYYNIFNKIYFVKGHSAMLYPSNELDEIITWHHKCTEGNSYISYVDLNAYPITITKQAISRKRHIIGWSQNAIHCVGTPDHRYEVRPSNAKRVGTNCLLHNTTLSPATPIPGTQRFKLLKHHYPDSRSPEQMPNIVRRLGSRFVCLWDLQDQRGWLVDGIGALAHLVCASVTSDEEQQPPAYLATKLDQLIAPQNSNQFNAPKEFLCHKDNQTAIILKYMQGGEEKAETLEDRILQYYDILDKAFTYQELLEKKLKQHPRQRLEGWDFQNLVWRKDDQHRALRTTIGPAGKGWVELLRDVKAVTLFGSGFGEIMKPSNAANPLCSKWQTLPTNQYYLAASVAILNKVMHFCGGNKKAHPQKLTRYISWYTPNALFDCCGCREGKDCAKHVQVLWPTKQLFNLGVIPEASATSCQHDGVVVFGHNELHDWYWPDHGLPEEGLPSSTLAVVSDSDDSESNEDEQTEDNVLTSWPSNVNLSLETSNTTPQALSNQRGHDQHSYGNSDLRDHARQHNGNVYIDKSRNTYNTISAAAGSSQMRARAEPEIDQVQTLSQTVECELLPSLEPPDNSDSAEVGKREKTLVKWKKSRSIQRLFHRRDKEK